MNRTVKFILILSLPPILSVSLSPASGQKRKNPVKVSVPVPDLKYFGFEAGKSLVYSSRKRKFLEGSWIRSPREMRFQILDVRKGEPVRIGILKETYRRSGGELEEQSLLEFSIFPSGARLRIEAVWVESDPKSVMLTGRREDLELARFPLRAGRLTGDLQVRSLEAAVETSTGVFRHCLEIGSSWERFVFAPHFGLVQWKVLDEEWTLKAVLDMRTDFSRVKLSTESGMNFRDAPLGENDDRQIEELARVFCKRYRVEFEKMLSVELDPSRPAIARSRFLVYRNDAENSNLRRYEVEERFWIREDYGGQILWGEQEGEAQGEKESPLKEKKRAGKQK